MGDQKRKERGMVEDQYGQGMSKDGGPVRVGDQQEQGTSKGMGPIRVGTKKDGISK